MYVSCYDEITRTLNLTAVGHASGRVKLVSLTVKKSQRNVNGLPNVVTDSARLFGQFRYLVLVSVSNV
jgi:hypothetical protein